MENMKPTVHLESLKESVADTPVIPREILESLCCSICLKELPGDTDRYMIKELADAGYDHLLCVTDWGLVKHAYPVFVVAMARFFYSHVSRDKDAEIKRLKGLLAEATGEEEVD